MYVIVPLQLELPATQIKFRLQSVVRRLATVRLEGAFGGVVQPSGAFAGAVAEAHGPPLELAVVTTAI